jgi:protein-tyrosine kinase
MSRIDEALRQAGIASRMPQAVQEPPPLDVFPTAQEPEIPEALPEEPSLRGPVSQAPVRPAPSRVVGDVKFAPAEKLVVHEGTGRTCVEQYRRIAAVLHHLQAERGTKVLMVASAGVGEGKTLTAANLALTLSESYRRRVLLIDADLRRPSLSAIFHLQSSRGLSEKLRGESDGPLRVLELSDSLALLPGGRPDSDPMAGLTSGRMRDIIQQAGESYDWVILDTPPVALQPDASLLAAMVEATVFVIATGMTPAAAIEEAIDAVGREKIVGVVLNRVESSASGEAEYHNYYPSPVGSIASSPPPGGGRMGL